MLLEAGGGQKTKDLGKLSFVWGRVYFIFAHLGQCCQMCQMIHTTCDCFILPVHLGISGLRINSKLPRSYKNWTKTDWLES